MDALTFRDQFEGECRVHGLDPQKAAATLLASPAGLRKTAGWDRVPLTLLATAGAAGAAVGGLGYVAGHTLARATDGDAGLLPAQQRRAKKRMANRELVRRYRDEAARLRGLAASYGAPKRLPVSRAGGPV